MEKSERISQLVYKYLTANISPEERAELSQWAAASNENQQLLDRLTNLNYLESELQKRRSVHVERPQRDMEARIATLHRSEDRRRSRLRPSLLLRRMAVAAMFMLIGGAAVYFWNSRSDALQPAKAHIAEAITHGETKATLTLENGETIQLGSNERENDVLLSKVRGNEGTGERAYSQPSGGQKRAPAPTTTHDNPRLTMPPLLKLTTPRGGEFKITLEDGTEVWLNAESQLRYPESFEQGERRVAVVGEAYFKVAKDAVRPFYVETGSQLVRVYGTEFNVHGYEDDGNIYTTLVSGSIAIMKADASGQLILSPGHQAVFDKDDSSTKVRTVDATTVTSWRTGRFVFENQTLEQIMKTLSRWYNFDYEFQDNRLRQTVFMGSVPRYGNFSEVLTILEKSGGLRFRQQGRTIIINH